MFLPSRTPEVQVGDQYPYDEFLETWVPGSKQKGQSNGPSNGREEKQGELHLPKMLCQALVCGTCPLRVRKGRNELPHREHPVPRASVKPTVAPTLRNHNGRRGKEAFTKPTRRANLRKDKPSKGKHPTR